MGPAAVAGAPGASLHDLGLPEGDQGLPEGDLGLPEGFVIFRRAAAGHMRVDR